MIPKTSADHQLLENFVELPEMLMDILFLVFVGQF